MSQSTRAATAIHYPCSDGKPLAENDLQLAAILYAVGALRVYFGGRKDVYVSGDLLIYYEEGNPRVSVAPDAFVVFGVEDRARMNYKTWEEGKGPDFVLEVASPSTWREDVGPKRSLYAGLGVREYALYDPTGKHLSPRLQGYRLVEGVYEPWPALESADGAWTLSSRTLGLDLRAKGARMRFHDPVTGQDLRSHAEEAAARQHEAAARRREAVALQREAVARKREAAARQYEAAARKREAAARQAAEARVAELEALLRK